MSTKLDWTNLRENLLKPQRVSKRIFDGISEVGLEPGNNYAQLQVDQYKDEPSMEWIYIWPTMNVHYIREQLLLKIDGSVLNARICDVRAGHKAIETDKERILLHRASRGGAVRIWEKPFTYASFMDHCRALFPYGTDENFTIDARLDERITPGVALKLRDLPSANGDRMVRLLTSLIQDPRSSDIGVYRRMVSRLSWTKIQVDQSQDVVNLCDPFANRRVSCEMGSIVKVGRSAEILNNFRKAIAKLFANPDSVVMLQLVGETIKCDLKVTPEEFLGNVLKNIDQSNIEVDPVEQVISSPASFGPQIPPADITLG